MNQQLQNVGRIIGGATIRGDKREFKGINKAKDKVKCDKAAHNSCIRAEHKLDGFQTLSILMMNYIRLIEIVEWG